MWLWSTTRHLNLVCLSVSSIWLVENQRFIRESTRRTKKVAWSSTFLRTIFSAWADIFLTTQLVMRLLKGGNLYQSGKVSMLEIGLKRAGLIKRPHKSFCFQLFGHLRHFEFPQLLINLTVLHLSGYICLILFFVFVVCLYFVFV